MIPPPMLLVVWLWLASLFPRAPRRVDCPPQFGIEAVRADGTYRCRRHIGPVPDCRGKRCVGGGGFDLVIGGHLECGSDERPVTNSRTGEGAACTRVD